MSDDPDETAGRKLYRAKADAVARFQAAKPRKVQLQKQCADCRGAGRIDFGDDTPMTCDTCGGTGMLP